MNPPAQEALDALYRVQAGILSSAELETLANASRCSTTGLLETLRAASAGAQPRRALAALAGELQRNLSSGTLKPEGAVESLERLTSTEEVVPFSEEEWKRFNHIVLQVNTWPAHDVPVARTRRRLMRLAASGHLLKWPDFHNPMRHGTPPRVGRRPEADTGRLPGDCRRCRAVSDLVRARVEALREPSQEGSADTNCVRQLALYLPPVFTDSTARFRLP